MPDDNQNYVHSTGNFECTGFIALANARSFLESGPWPVSYMHRNLFNGELFEPPKKSMLA